MTLLNKGRRTYEFKNGDVITANFPKEIYGGVFLGSLRSETVGGLELNDEKNELKCEIKFGKVKKK